MLVVVRHLILAHVKCNKEKLRYIFNLKPNHFQRFTMMAMRLVDINQNRSATLMPFKLMNKPRKVLLQMIMITIEEEMLLRLDYTIQDWYLKLMIMMVSSLESVKNHFKWPNKVRELRKVFLQEILVQQIMPRIVVNFWDL